MRKRQSKQKKKTKKAAKSDSQAECDDNEETTWRTNQRKTTALAR